MIPFISNINSVSIKSSRKKKRKFIRLSLFEYKFINVQYVDQSKLNSREGLSICKCHYRKHEEKLKYCYLLHFLK